MARNTATLITSDFRSDFGHSFFIRTIRNFRILSYILSRLRARLIRFPSHFCICPHAQVFLTISLTE